jgi:hypothetical protein
MVNGDTEHMKEDIEFLDARLAAVSAVRSALSLSVYLCPSLCVSLSLCVYIARVFDRKPARLLLTFASVPDSSQNQTAVLVYEGPHLLPDFRHDHGRPTVLNFHPALLVV